ncbi:MAG: CehA/McbA family metallohydrolase [Pseudomonadota bacterium]
MRLSLALLCALIFSTPAAAETLTLTGVMTGADHETYREVPFQVPAGTASVTVEFAYTGKAEKSVIDLGLRDPQRFRGWSGGNKARFTVTETWATPSYLSGPLPAGEWKLILGVPNLRKDARAEYTAKITVDPDPSFHGFADSPLKTGAAWYRGDLHLHTGHSDGSCAGRTGARVPCPLFKTLEAAAGRGLDFVAVTEHNTTAHHDDLAEMQPYYGDLLLIPGREITTFKGHANVWGVTAPLDFQLGGPRAPDLGAILDQVERLGGVFSINHPGLPSGELCMGCGWTARTDFARVPAIEVINGTATSGPLTGLAFWDAQLNAGHRITGVAGSDNHDATLMGERGVGAPTTVVLADDLSQYALLAGIRAGHVFIDVRGTRDAALEMTASARGAKAGMGDVLVAPAGAAVEVVVDVRGAMGQVVFVGPAAARLSPSAALGIWRMKSDGKPGWLRAEIRAPDGKPLLIGNPIYLRPR